MRTRLDDVIDDLAQAAEGRRALPVLQPAEAAAVCTLFAGQVDKGMDALERAAAAAGRPLACRAGCADCCRSLPAIYAGEAVTIARWLDDHAEARAGFDARYPAWVAALGDLVDAWRDAAARADVADGERIATEARRRGVMCAFNDGGRCTIYEVRPLVCRTAHAVDTSARCAPDATEPVLAWTLPALEAYLDRIRPLLIAMHHALGERTGAAPLCAAVRAQVERGSK